LFDSAELNRSTASSGEFLQVAPHLLMIASALYIEKHVKQVGNRDPRQSVQLCDLA
jgi:hypothetical protein